MTEESGAQPEAEGKAETARVEFTPEQQKRFNQVWAKAKSAEELAEQVLKDHRVLMEKLEAKERSEAEARALAELRTEKVQAWEKGEYEKAAQIDERLIELKSKPKEEPKVEKQPEKQPELAAEEREFVQSWATERDADGHPKRPWADPGHPQFQRMLKMAETLATDPEFQGTTPLETMKNVSKEIDRIFHKPKAEAKQAAVLSSDGNARPGKKVQLTTEQKYIAQKMGISEERYAARLAS